MCRLMRTGHVAIDGKRRSKPILGTAKPCCDIAKDLHLRGPPRILQQAKVVFRIPKYSYRFRPQASLGAFFVNFPQLFIEISNNIIIFAT